MQQTKQNNIVPCIKTKFLKLRKNISSRLGYQCLGGLVWGRSGRRGWRLDACIQH